MDSMWVWTEPVYLFTCAGLRQWTRFQWPFRLSEAPAGLSLSRCDVALHEHSQVHAASNRQFIFLSLSLVVSLSAQTQTLCFYTVAHWFAPVISPTHSRWL